MKQSSRSLDVLKKLLDAGVSQTAKEVADSPDELVNEFLHRKEEPVSMAPKPKKRGRPEKENHLKARNLTLCLDPKYIAFLDRMKVHDKKIQGRGRKVRFIIDQFLELHHRQRLQLDALASALENVDKALQGLRGQVKKGQQLTLDSSEKREISKAVNQVLILGRVLGYTRKDLHRLLPRKKWSLYAFCLDWVQRQGGAQ